MCAADLPVQPHASSRPGRSRRRHVVRRVQRSGSEAVRILRSLTRAGRVVRKRNRVSLLRQFCDQTWLYVRHDLESRDYYQFRLYEPAGRARAGDFISQRQNAKLLRRILPADQLVWDKAAFARSCAEHGLPAIPILAEWREGRLVSMVHDWPDELYTKPALSLHGSGSGVRAWKGGRSVIAEMERFLKEEMGQRIAIVQPRLMNHPDLMRISNGCLSTLRIISCLLPDGTIETLLPTLRMGVGSSPVDNFRQGNIVAPVISSSGRLGAAQRRDADAVIWPVGAHPDTGYTVEGVCVPFHAEALALCRRAHQLFARPPMIGWDVAITSNGPVLVEGNYLFGTEATQVAHGAPLGHPTYLGCAETSW